MKPDNCPDVTKPLAGAPSVSSSELVRLREAITNRELAKRKVLAEMEQHTQHGTLATNSQMPSWPEYGAACLALEKLNAELVQPNDKLRHGGENQ